MSADQHKSLFDKFKTDFSRSYESETEETMRFGLFKVPADGSRNPAARNRIIGTLIHIPPSYSCLTTIQL